MIKRRFLTLGAVALSATALLLGGPNGTRALAQQIPPLPPPGIGVPSDALGVVGFATISDTDGDNGVDLTASDPGTFTFASTAAVCASEVLDGLDAGDPGGPCTISGNGSFVNQVCGTGTASGSGFSVTGPEPGTLSFTIWFNATIGVIEGAFNDSTEGSTEPLAGVVLITADPFAPPPGGDDCARGFGVVGGGVAFEGPGS